MKQILTVVAATALTLSSCGSKNNSQSADTVNDTIAEAEVVYSLLGKWNIENIVVNDAVSVRPDSIDAYFDFKNDSAYVVATGCNSIQGGYALVGDSIKWGNSLKTTMLCPDNMAVEDILTQVLPNVVVVDFENDTVARLNTSVPDQYIVLSKEQSKQ